jgi:hypothetical protein
MTFAYYLCSLSYMAVYIRNHRSYDIIVIIKPTAQPFYTQQIFLIKMRMLCTLINEFHYYLRYLCPLNNYLSLCIIPQRVGKEGIFKMESLKSLTHLCRVLSQPYESWAVCIQLAEMSWHPWNCHSCTKQLTGSNWENFPWGTKSQLGIAGACLVDVC